MTLSLPLPVKTERSIECFLHPLARAGEHVALRSIAVTVPIVGTVLELKKAVESVCGISHERLCVREIFNSKFDCMCAGIR